MKHQLLFIDYEKRNIEDKELLCINILDYYSKQVIKIYKKFNNDFIKKLDSFQTFDNIDEYITYVIKRDGKISLDINL